MERLRIDEVIEHCKRHTEIVEAHLSRMQLEETPIGESGFMKRYWEHRQVAEWLEELKRYEDAEENGLLIHLPCRVGDTVYILAGCFGTFYEEDICDGFYVGRDGVLQVKVLNNKGNHGTYGVMGKTVFLAKEEAEQTLKQMGGR